MEIGQRLKEARLAAGLSQRQLCGDVITRNMLSQIENGSAKPSMDTLRYLAGVLGLSVSYFLEEDAASPNAACLRESRDAFCRGAFSQALELLGAYRGPDIACDAEKWYLESVCLTALAEAAAAEGKQPYALELLEKADAAGASTPYDTQGNRRSRQLLRLEIDCDPALVEKLPDITPEMLARAKVCLQSGDARGCLGYLAMVDTPEGELIKGDAYVQQQNFQAAAAAFHKAETAFPDRVTERLELCYRELGDYKMAYFYACKGRK